MSAARTLAVIALGAATVAAAVGQEPTRKELLLAFEKQLKTAAAAAGPSVACVVVSRSEHYPKPAGDAAPGKLGGFDPKEFLKADASKERAVLARSLDLSDPKSIPDHGYVGGVVIDPSGLVLTPYHAIDGATRVYVFLPGGSGSYADIHAADARSDLAVLKLLTPPANLKAIKFGDVSTADAPGRPATLFTGKLVVLMANPYSTGFALDRPSAAFGSLTNVRHELPKPGPNVPRSDSYYKYGTLLEHDVKLNAAVTGSALVNLDGEMIGLTTSAAVVAGGELGPGFAIPADDNFRRVVEALRRGEEVEYGFLGVVLGNPDNRGILIGRTTPGGPAALGGVGEGDTIIKINDVPVSNYDDLLIHIGAALAGAKTRLTLSRFGRQREVMVTLGKFRHDQPFIASVRPEAVFGLRVDYGSILAQQLNTDPAPGTDPPVVPAGVSIREITTNSPAATRFKTLGDAPTRWLVTHVNGAPVASPAEFYKAAKGQAAVKLTLLDPTEKPTRPRELTLP